MTVTGRPHPLHGEGRRTFQNLLRNRSRYGNTTNAALCSARKLNRRFAGVPAAKRADFPRSSRRGRETMQQKSTSSPLRCSISISSVCYLLPGSRIVGHEWTTASPRSCSRTRRERRCDNQTSRTPHVLLMTELNQRYTRARPLASLAWSHTHVRVVRERHASS